VEDVELDEVWTVSPVPVFEENSMGLASSYCLRISSLLILMFFKSSGLGGSTIN
jgi:hypothetical protein